MVRSPHLLPAVRGVQATVLPIMAWPFLADTDYPG
jgi:hypothetical protein